MIPTSSQAYAMNDSLQNPDSSEDNSLAHLLASTINFCHYYHSSSGQKSPLKPGPINNKAFSSLQTQHQLVSN